MRSEAHTVLRRSRLIIQILMRDEDWNYISLVKGMRGPLQNIETIRCKIALLKAQFLYLILSQTFCSLCLNSD